MPILGPFATAPVVKKAACGAGEFKDALYNTRGSIGGSCWTCPKTWDRTIFPVYGKRACEKGGGYEYKTAEDKGALTCPAGEIFDFVGLNANDMRTRPELKGKSGIKTVKSGTCWSCPSGYDRTMVHVKKSGACEAKTMAWYSVPYQEPGFFKLKGSEQTLIDLTKQRPDLIQGAIDAAAKAAAKDKNGKVNQAKYKKNLAAERKTFATEPHNSVSAAGSVFTRLMMVVGNTKKASAAEKELLKSFQDYIIAKRTHIAQDALDAYDAWLRADTYWKGQRNKGNMMVLFDFGTVPPDFSVIAMTNAMGLGVVDFALGQGAEKVVGDAIPMIGDILSLGLNIATNTDSIADPSQAWRWAMRSAAEVAIGKAAEFAVAKLAKSTAAALFKQVGQQFAHLGAPKLVQAAATQAGKSVLSAAGSAGPQIIITASIMIGTMAFDQMMEILNARPKLLTALATGKYPPNLARMAKTEKGMMELMGYWSQLISEHPKPTSKFTGEFTQVANAALAAKVKMATKKTASKSAVKKASASSLRLKGRWTAIKGNAYDIGVGANGKVWMIGTKKEGGGYGIYRWDRKWKKINGSALRIAVGPKGNAWLVNNKGAIFRYDGRRWIQLKGPKAVDIGVGANGSVWIIGGKKEAGGYAIHRLERGNKWRKINGSAMRITVGPKGNAWIVNNKGSVYRFDGRRWFNVKGVKATDIGVGAKGHIWALGGKKGKGGYQVWSWTGRGWKNYPGQLTNIAVGPKGRPYGVNALKNIYVMN